MSNERETTRSALALAKVRLLQFVGPESPFDRSRSLKLDLIDQQLERMQERDRMTTTQRPR